MAKYVLPRASLVPRSPLTPSSRRQVRDGGEPEVSRRRRALQVQSGGQGEC
jgi:hypothetical protein